jgi:ABC-2 type transport system ATP-binding protein
VKLAQAIVHDPVLVLLDEPTAGLDPDGRQDMLRLIHRTANTFGISVMLSTHLMGDVERTADSVIVLESGVLAQEGAVAKLTEDTETLLIEVADRHEEFVTALAAKGVQASDDGQLLIVEQASEADYDLIRDAAVESGARIRRLSPERRTLTDIFRSRPE